MAELVVRSAGIRKFLGSNPIRHFYKKKKKNIRLAHIHDIEFDAKYCILEHF